MRVASFRAPLAVAWQLTRRCDLRCLHCLNSCGPDLDSSEELSRRRCLALARGIGANQVPYVILCGGEPMLSPHFWAVAETLGNAGVGLKVETNGQRFREADAARLARLPIRSIQVSLDGASQGAYEALRPGASLSAAQEACRLIRRAGMPLEVSFAPVRFNIDEVSEAIDAALELGAFRFNTGMLIRRGRADAGWEGLSPGEGALNRFFGRLVARERELEGRMELCFRPFTFEEQVRSELGEPSGTLVVRPDGKVRVSAAADLVCADLRKQGLTDAWRAYLRARRDPRVVRVLEDAIERRGSPARKRLETRAGLCLAPATRS